MYSCIVDGKVLDYKFVKTEVCYNFYIGDIFIGQIFKWGKHNWTAIPFHKNTNGISVYGFGTRLLASDYLLKNTGFIKSH